MEKQNTPLQMAIDKIKDSKYNNPNNAEAQSYDEALDCSIRVLTELLPIEREVIEKAVAFGQMQDIKKTNFLYPDDYFNQTFN